MQVRRSLSAALTSAILALVAGALAPALAQPSIAGRAEGVFSIGIPNANDPRPEPEQAPAADGPAPAQIQAVWDLGATGNWASASRLLTSLEATHRSWRAPGDLKAHLATGRRNNAITAALSREDWTSALALIPAAAPGRCEAPFEVWARAEALEGIGEPAETTRFYVRVLSVCRDSELTAKLTDRAASVLDINGLVAIAGLDPLSDNADPRIMIAHAHLLKVLSRKQFEAAAQDGALEAAGAIAASSGDPGLLTQAGWTFIEQDAARAASYFDQALAAGADGDARRGLTMAMLAQGNVSSARRTLAKAADPSAFADISARVDLADAADRRDAGDWRAAIELADKARRQSTELEDAAQDIRASVLLAQSGEAYDEDDFANARAFAQEAARHPAYARAGGLRAAWSDLQLGNASAAASAFGHLYAETPDTESAEGYALAAEKSGDLDDARALARALGGPLGEKVNARYAEAAFNDGDYLTARAYSPESFEALEGIDRAWYRQSFAAKAQDGTEGENKLNGFVSTTSAGLSRGADRFEAGVAIYTLDSGGGSAAAQEDFAVPYAAWSREGRTSLAARIGLLPLGADADVVAIGEFAAAHETGGRAIEARAFIHPKAESMRAFAGKPGRVLETGAALRGRWPLGERHAVQFDLSAAHLEGEQAASNSMLGAGVSASRSIARDGFAYLVTGPFYQFQAYDRNTNFFTAGHGGYFSPQSFHRAGWSLNGQTDPLKKWIAKADLAVAYEAADEDPALANPLLPGPQAMIGGGESDGIAGAVDFAVARRVSADVIVSANVSAIKSKAYEDFRIGISFTWVPGGRDGLVRADLPSDPFNAASWVQP